MNRTRKALQWLAEDPKRTPHAAAKQFALAPPTVYRAVAALKKPRCQCCGQVLPNRKEEDECATT